MTSLRTRWSRLNAIVSARRLRTELREEIRSHLDEAQEEYERQGMSPEAARSAALRSFGGVAQAEEAYGDQLSAVLFRDLRGDVRQALRALRHSPGFAAVVVTVLAVGIGALVAIAALLHAIVLRPLPYPDADRLVVIEHATRLRSAAPAGLSDGLLVFYRRRARSFESMGSYQQTILNFRTPDGASERVRVARASAELFEVLRTTPVAGRLYRPDEQPAAAVRNGGLQIPILLSYDFWRRIFGADPGIQGRVVWVNDTPRQIVGVLPPGFAFPAHTDVWMIAEPVAARAAFDWLRLSTVARLAPGATVESAERELRAVLPTIEGAYPDATHDQIATAGLEPIVRPLKTSVIGEVGDTLWTLFMGMTALLVIAAANTASLFAVRIEQRRREIAVRRALGAHGLRVARLFFVEALVLTLSGAAASVALAWTVLRAVVRLTPAELPRAAEIGIDGWAIGFAVLVALLLAVLYGVLAARRVGVVAPAGLLGSVRSASDRAAGGAKSPFIAIQVGLALMLAAGSGLMLRTYVNLSRSTLGFDPDHVLTVEISLPYRQAARFVQIYRDTVSRLAALPGVNAASGASFLPLSPREDDYPVEPATPPVEFKFFVPGFFETLRVPIAAGQSLASGEHVTAPFPVLVSASLARRLYADERPIGRPVRRLMTDGSLVTKGNGPVPDFTIVGVVGDVRESSLRGPAPEVVYVPLLEPPVEQSIVPTNMTMILRTTVPPLSLAPSVRRTITDMGAGLSVGPIRTMDAIVSAARSPETFVGGLLGAAAVVSLCLGLVGVYGGVVNGVRGRTREMGIRLALGANPAQLVRLVVSEAMPVISAGMAGGLAGAVASAGILRSFLFGVGPRDPVALAAASVLLLGTAAGAAWLAARRAAHIEPATTLRAD